jgi:lactoylglutathione lyase
MATTASTTRKESNMIKRVDHAAIVVKDLDESIRFYTETIGLTLRRVFDVPEFNLRVAFLGKGEKEGGAEIELMKFQDPEKPIGFRHVSIIVSDIASYIRKAEGKGAEVTMQPTKISAGDIAAMVRDPNGIIIEFLQKPEGRSK